MKVPMISIIVLRKLVETLVKKKKTVKIGVKNSHRVKNTIYYNTVPSGIDLNYVL